MRITESLLKKYVDLDRKAREIEFEKQQIRLVLIADGRTEIEVGDMLAEIANAERLTAKSRDDIYRIVKDKRVAARCFKTVRFHKVTVRER